MKRQILIMTTLICFQYLGCNNPTTNYRQKKTFPITEKILDRKHYQLKYYSDMSIDSTDKDFDIESYFVFNTASNYGSTTFFIFNSSINEKELCEEQVKSHLSKTIKNGKVANFNTWGKYKGHGASITGKFLGVMNGELKIFVHSSDSSSFLTVYQFFARDKEKDLPGLKLIEKTFRIK